MTEFNYDDPKQWKKVHKDIITTPKSNTLCMCDKWWAVTKDGYVLFFKGHSPQYNSNKEVVQRIRPDCTVEFISVAYLPHKCSDYV